jgi:hypothetical protein
MNLIARQSVRISAGYNSHRIGALVSSCEHGNEPFGHIKDEEFKKLAERLSVSQKDFISWS